MEPEFESGVWRGYSFGKGEKNFCAAVTTAEIATPGPANRQVSVMLGFQHKAFTVLDDNRSLLPGRAQLRVGGRNFPLILAESFGFLIGGSDFEEVVSYLESFPIAYILKRGLHISVNTDGLEAVHGHLSEACLE